MPQSIVRTLKSKDFFKKSNILRLNFIMNKIESSENSFHVTSLDVIGSNKNIYSDAEFEVISSKINGSLCDKTQ